MQLACRSRCSKWQPAPLRAPRRRRKAMMLQALPSNLAGEPRDPPRPSLPARRPMGLGRRAKRNGALAAPEPQNGHSSTKQYEHPSSYSCIRPTGRSDAWRDPCGLADRGVRGCTGLFVARGDGFAIASLVNIDNRCKRRDLQRIYCSFLPHVAQLHLLGSSTWRALHRRGAIAK